ncbi:hypothetical protein DIPPA_33541 [Diplonema papillatum]|nr:hypothetical protein DIPPA_33541 [Diplonema papillatum]
MPTEEAPNVLPDDPEAPHIRQYDNDTAAGEPSPFKRRVGEHPRFSKRVLIGAALMVVLGIIAGGCFVASGAFSLGTKCR